MRPFGVVEVEVVRQAGPEVETSSVAHQIDALILNATPEALNHDVVKRTASTIHADLNASCQHGVGERMGSELSALIGVKDVWSALLEGLTQSFQAKLTIQGIGDLPSQHVSAVPIDTCTCAAGASVTAVRYMKPRAMGM